MTLALLDPRTDQPVNMVQPVNLLHPLNRGLISWHLALPGAMGGARYMDILSPGPNGNHGVLTSMDPATDWVPSRRSGAWGQLDFDGTDDHVVTGDLNIESTDLTFMAWIFRDVGGDQTVFSKWDNSGGNGAKSILFRCNASDRLQLFTHDGASQTQKQSGDGIVPLTTQLHVAFVYDEATDDGQFYVNGVPKPNSTTDDTLSKVQATTTNIVLGRFADSVNAFDGPMDDFRIYKRKLTELEVFTYYGLSQQGYPGLLNRLRRPIIDVSAALTVGEIMAAVTLDAPPEPIPVPAMVGY